MGVSRQGIAAKLVGHLAILSPSPTSIVCILVFRASFASPRKPDPRAGDLPLPKIIFLCTENSNRSQMAEAFARLHGAGVVEAWSAGSKASGQVNPKAVAAMAEKGYDLASHRSQSTDDVPPGPYDVVITMGCGDQCPWIAGRERQDWGLPDPRDMDADAYGRVRDEIETRVLQLLSRWRSG